MEEIGRQGSFRIRYRLMINGSPKPVMLKIASIREEEQEKLAVAIREWKETEQ